MKRALALLALLVLPCAAQAGALMWTNPPGRVLGVHFLVTAQGGPAPGAWTIDYPLYFVSAAGDTTWRSHGGEPDTLWFTGVCHTAPVSYSFVCFAWNEYGMCKLPSNGGVPLVVQELP